MMEIANDATADVRQPLVWPVGTAATTCVSCGKIIIAELRFCCECHEGERLVGVPAEPPSAAEKSGAAEAGHRDSSKFTLSDLRAQLAILKAKADRVREADLQAAIAKVEAPRADKPQSKHGRGTIHMGGSSIAASNSGSGKKSKGKGKGTAEHIAEQATELVAQSV